ncbi:MAG TPA: PQQ-binding-like beta-propeller repeat protein [Dehalococcoidia bacterium]|nr:PQQ-binding-like beta-propeller repeat protein [Dehalococcoidia bacterium]
MHLIRCVGAIAVLLALGATLSGRTGEVERTVFPMATRWSVDVAGAPATAPVSDDRQVYLALAGGGIVAHGLTDGAQRWRRDGLTADQPLATDGTDVFVAAAHAIHALRAADGRDAWQHPDITPTAPLLAAAGWVFAATADGVVALRARDGSLVWRREAGDVRERPALEGDRLYLSRTDGNIVALRVDSGAPVWQQKLGGAPGGVYATADRVYAGAADKYFYCLDAATGQIEWESRVGATFQGAPAGDAMHVYFTALDNTIRALDRGNGAVRWWKPLADRPATGPIVVGITVLVPAAGAELWSFDTRSGQSTGTVPIPPQLAVPPALTNQGKAGLLVFAITGNLSNQWKLTLVETAGDPPLEPLPAIPGWPPLIAGPSRAPLTALPGEVHDIGTPPLGGRVWVVPLSALPGVSRPPGR